MRREPGLGSARMALAPEGGQDDSTDEPPEQPPSRPLRMQRSSPEIESFAVHVYPSTLSYRSGHGHGEPTVFGPEAHEFVIAARVRGARRRMSHILRQSQNTGG